MTPRGLAVVVALLSLVGAARAEGVAEITEADLRRQVATLASEAFGGRDTGGPDGHRAEDHVAAAFAAAGLASLPGAPEHRLRVPLERPGVDPAASRLDVTVGGARCPLDLHADWRPGSLAEVRGAGPLVFAGYGIVAPEAAHDDYAGLDVRGKVVLVLGHEPRESDPWSVFAGTERTPHAELPAKVEAARSRGAAALLHVTDPLHHPGPEDLRAREWPRLKAPPTVAAAPVATAPPPTETAADAARGSDAARGEGRGSDRSETAAESRPVQVAAAPAPSEPPPPPPFPLAQVSRDTAQWLLARSGRTLAQIQDALDHGAPPSTFAIDDVRADLVVEGLDAPAEVVAHDVAGWLEGSDPGLRGEVVLVGAHHDHLGRFAGRGDTLYEGADDNASGTAVVLELAQWFGAAAHRPRRSVAFVTFTGEERGLLGSKWLADSGILALDRIALVINLDMVGRNSGQPIEVIGDGWARGLASTIRAANATEGLELALAGDEYFGQSDHDVFAKRDVPFLFFYTGTHADYHETSDSTEKLDYPRMERLARLVRDVVVRVADADARPTFVHHVTWAGLRAEARSGRTVVTGVERGSRAASAGVREGDVIVAIDGTRLDAGASVGARMRSIAPGSEADVELDRDGEAVRATVHRAVPGWLGVFPTTLDAEQRRALGLEGRSALQLREVVENGPAARAGLRGGDVLLELDGEPVVQRTLTARLEALGAGRSVDALVLRDGTRMTLRLTLGERPGR